MTKEEALNDFLRGLRIALNNALAYPKSHPYFVKSAENFKQKIDAVFAFLEPVRVGIGVNLLSIEGVNYDKADFHLELASIFHLRKIKGIEFKKGVGIEELVDFLSALSSAPKEIIAQGGINTILDKQKHPCILVEELDYSQLVGGEGEEYKDIWKYLLSQAVIKQDEGKIKELASDFDKIIAKFNAADLTNDQTLRENLRGFFGHLKGREKEKFYSCTKSLLKSFLSDKSMLEEVDLSKTKSLFQECQKDDIAEVLLGTISKDASYNNLSFGLFARLFEEGKHREIASALGTRLQNPEFLKANPQVVKKIKELFYAPSDSPILPLYRNALSWLSDENLPKDRFYFDHQALSKNYRMLLLNLFAGEKERESLSVILERMPQAFQEALENKDSQYLKSLLETLRKREAQEPSYASLFEGLEGQISSFVENVLWQGNASAEIEYLLDSLKKTSLDAPTYLKRIFEENKANPRVLKLFFRFFPEALPVFYKNLEGKHSDIEFLVEMIQNLSALNNPPSLEALKYIYSFANELLKIETLKSMQKLSVMDEEFLFSVLAAGTISTKKEALIIISRDEQAKKETIDSLLLLKSPWGRKNKLILENISIIEGLGLKEAVGCLKALSKRRFFWNRVLRDKARAVLEEWNAG